MSDIYKSFQTLIHEMKTVARSISCKANNLEDLLQQLPDEAGVFLIQHGNVTLHVGRVSKAVNKGIQVGGTIRGKIRYSKTPFHFKGDQLHYKPMGDLVNPSAYVFSVPLSEVSVTCFICEPGSRLMPSTLQTLLLQGHLNQFSNLPTCNLRS
jgi:hypothetical protein